MKKKVILICPISILVLFVIGFLVFKDNYNNQIDNRDKGGYEIDIGDDEAIKIALDDAGITWNDLSYGNGDIGWIDRPVINKSGSGERAVYTVEFNTNQDINFFYKLRAFDGKILYKVTSK